MEQLSSSYRDKDGFVFRHNGSVYRYLHPGYLPVYDYFIRSSLYDDLSGKGMILLHEEMPDTAPFGFEKGKVLKPEQLHFISYPYEWSFDMWKDAALLTLETARLSLDKGMMLKDATPFNIQFRNGSPVLIDTLSFELYKDGDPWVAYRQFCESFLGPLLLMKYTHPGAGRLFVAYPNGIPLNELVTLLPGKASWKLNNYLHIFLQASLARRNQGKQETSRSLSRQKLELLLNGLLEYVNKLQVKKMPTAWDDYYTGTIMGEGYLKAKTAMVFEFTGSIVFDSVTDLGANDGHFSKGFKGKPVIALDADPNCINDLYLWAKKEKADLLPLVADLTLPSPAIGFANRERDSLTSRLRSGLVLALALVHNLTIAKNIPLRMILEWLKPMGEYLLIEFVPKEDENVQLLLQNRTDIFNDYTPDYFRTLCTVHFTIIREELIPGSKRILFLLKRK